LIAIKELTVDCRYDLFHQNIIVKGYQTSLTKGDVLEDLDNTALKVRQTVLTKFGFDPGINHTLDALKMTAFDHVFDPVCDYLSSLRWDGAPRLDNWLTAYCGAPDTPLNRAIGRKMLIAAVRRARNPGCKFDYIIVFESYQQGVGKSTVLKILAGEENFSDAEILGLDKQEQQEAVQGVWIYEIAELEGLTKAEVTKVKMFASKTHDMARPAYGRDRRDLPRRCIFVATTNDDKYLRDTTGNRRFWPVKTPLIDLEAISRDRDQLWAEAVLAESAGESLVIPEALWPDATKQQLARMEIDPWEDTLKAKFVKLIERDASIDGCFIGASDNNGDPEWRVSTSYILDNVLQIPTDRQFQNHSKRLSGVMRTLGWTRSETTFRIGSAVCRGFVKPYRTPPTRPSLYIATLEQSTPSLWSQRFEPKEKKEEKKEAGGGWRRF
jgi:predicted P-loop ATPase